MINEISNTRMPMYNFRINLLGIVTSRPLALAKKPALTKIADNGKPILTIHAKTFERLAWSVSISAINEKMTKTPAWACPARNIDF